MKYVLIIALMLQGVWAAPALLEEIDFKQKDGTTFKGHLKGDEHFSWIEDKEGHVIVYNKASKNYEFATLKEVNGSIELLPTGVKKLKEGAIMKVFSPAVSASKIDRSVLKKIWKEKRAKKKFLY